MTDSLPIADLNALLEHGGWVRALAFSLAADAATAEDIEQKTWLAAIERPPKTGTNPRAWLGAVVRNIARMHWREQSARRRREKVVSENRWVQESRIATSVQPDSLAERLDTFRKLAVALAELPNPYGATLYLRFFEGLTVREIAERMNVPEPTAQARLARGLSKLRAELNSTLGKDWRDRCLVFTIPFTKVASGGLITVLTMTLKTKILIGAAALAVVSLLTTQPWEKSQVPIELGIESVSLENKGPSGNSDVAPEVFTAIDRAPFEPSTSKADEAFAADNKDLSFVIQVRDGNSLEAIGGVEILYFDYENSKFIQANQLARDEYMDIEERLERFGTRHQTDEKGMLHLLPPKGAVEFVARKGNLFGYNSFDPKRRYQKNPIEVLMHPVISQRVFVKGENGQPAAGVVVGFSPYPADQATMIFSRASTNSLGVADFLHLEVFMQYGKQEKGNTVCLTCPSATPQYLELSDAELGQRDLYLVMPATGSVKVICKYTDGSPLEDGTILKFQTAANNPIFKGSLVKGFQQVPVKNGVAIFPVVGVGTELVVAVRSASRNGHHTSTGSGPSRPGEEVTIELVLPTKATPVKVRLVGPDKTILPAAEMAMTFNFLSLLRGPGETFSTAERDSSGLVLVPMDGPSQAMASQTSVVLYERPSSATPGQIDFAILSINLENLEVQHEPLQKVLGESVVVAGSVVDASGQPVKNEELQLTILLTPNSRKRAEPLAVLRLTTDEQGRFRISGPSQNEIYSYSLHLARDLISRKGLSFRHGQEDLVVEIPGQETFSGRILLDNPEWYRNLNVQAVRIGDERGESNTISYSSIEYPNGRFELRRLPAANVELQVYQRGGFELLAQIPLVSLASQESQQAELPVWDLRNKLFLHQLNVKTESEAPLYNLIVVTDHDRASSRWVPDEPFFLFASEAVLDMEIGADNYRSQPCRSTGVVDIVLHPGLPIHLKLPEGLLLPQNSYWNISFSSNNEMNEGASQKQNGMLVAELRNHGYSTETILPTPGIWRVEINLYGFLTENSRFTELGPALYFIDGTTSFTIHVEDMSSEQVFTIPVAPEAIEEAVLNSKK